MLFLNFYQTTSRLIKTILTGLVLFFVAFSSLALAATDTLTNQMKNNPSPYLEMHYKDPVNWQLWQKDTLETAQKENRLIFVSSGYFACHWCHVMQKESYQNSHIAKLLNKSFLNIKVDRELTPDLDQYLINFARKTTGVAGWPQHVFFTPSGYPFYSFIYLSPKQFNILLTRLTALWEEDPESLEQVARKAMLETKPAIHSPSPFSNTEFSKTLLKTLYPRIDGLSGGLKTTAKFPNVPLLQALLDETTLPEEIEEWLIFTLDQMQSEYNHLLDHVNGGFYRYTIDPEWQTPHFEKMLYTQAMLIRAYFQAGKQFDRSDYLVTAQRTLDYAKQHLFSSKVNLFLSSQSALDKLYKEGGNYIFSKEMLKKLLTQAEFDVVNKEWRLQLAPPYDTGWHPKPTSQYWSSIQAKLKVSPTEVPTDAKSLLGWNGLMLSAYAQGYLATPNQNLLAAGQKLADDLLRLITDPNPPRALSLTGGFMGQANIQDYAFIIQGLTDWLTILKDETQQKHLLKQIETLRQTAQDKFLTPKGWLISEAPLLPGQTGIWAMQDDAIPSPTAILDCSNDKNLANASTKIKTRPIIFASYLNCSTR